MPVIATEDTKLYQIACFHSCTSDATVDTMAHDAEAKVESHAWQMAYSHAVLPCLSLTFLLLGNHTYTQKGSLNIYSSSRPPSRYSQNRR